MPKKASAPRKSAPRARKTSRRRKKTGHPMLMSFALGASIGVALCAISAAAYLYRKIPVKDASQPNTVKTDTVQKDEAAKAQMGGKPSSNTRTKKLDKDKSSTSKPSTAKDIAKKPAAVKPAADKSIAKKPNENKPSATKPAIDTPPAPNEGKANISSSAAIASPHAATASTSSANGRQEEASHAAKGARKAEETAPVAQKTATASSADTVSSADAASHAAVKASPSSVSQTPASAAQTPAAKSAPPASSAAHTAIAAVSPASAAIPDSLPPAARLSIPHAVHGARLAVVFDDAGGDVASLKHCLSLPFPITVAVMPALAHSRQCADEARAAGAEVLLHQPMQAQNLNINPGALAVTPSMSAEDAARLVASNMEELGRVAGVNNHEGSLITENTEVMAAIMKTVQLQGAYFLDSRTTSGTKVGVASSVTGIPYYERDVFLDNSRDKKAIMDQVRRALDIANRDGAAIMIGHVRADDALSDTLKDIFGDLSAAGYVFCTVSKSGALRGL